ncbi:putative transporter [Teratosphaeria nubilosa]|uniref:Putative transporter n=1 Tax=Teratosphaeria nubilosa TaxID=161662 RepID=A0A6G1L1U7_9PEZI|nr:putative transporter [Teratosphaeria nubilosa]
MSQFQHDFGVFNPTTQTYSIPTTWQSLGTGTPIAGIVLGTFTAGALGNRLGRIRTFWLATGIGLVGILIQATSLHSYWQIMVGRIINGVYMGILCNAAPTYISECAPARLRGSLVNTYQSALLFAAVMVSTCNWGTHARTDQWAYRVPLLIQFVAPVLLIAGGFVIPESPRWLVVKGREGEAVRVLRGLRGKGVAVEEEVRVLAAAVEEQRVWHCAGGWGDCFRGVNLRRTLIGVGVQCLQPATGSAFVTAYAILFLQTVGIEDEYQILVLLYLVGFVGNAMNFYLSDRVGRRTMMLWCAVVMAACMFVIGGLTGYDDDSGAGKTGALAAIFIWNFVDSVGWSGCVWITCAEVPTAQLRERSMTISTASSFAVNLMVTYVNPYLQNAGAGDLQGKVGFVYGGFCVGAVVWVFLFLPEMKGRSLEELDELFERRVGTLRFGGVVTEGLGAEVTRLERCGGEGKVIVGVAVEEVPAVDVEGGGDGKKREP